MSRIGKEPIEIPKGVDVKVAGATVTVKGPGGVLTRETHSEVSVVVEAGLVKVTRSGDNRIARSMHGLTRTLIANMIKGVSEGFVKKLEIVGVGYKAAAQGSTLTLNLGYSNPIKYELPKGVSVAIEKQTSLEIKGADKQLIGQVAAEIRAFRKPEPYKGKGIKYADEHIRRKAGKAIKAVGT